MSYHRQLFYDEHNNIIWDEWGEIVFNIFEIITPNVLALFKKQKGYMVTYSTSGQLIELVYQELPFEY